MKSLKLVPVLLVTLLLLGGISVMAAGSPGSPTASIGEGRFSVGYDYSFHRMDAVADHTRRANELGPMQGERVKARRVDVRRHYMTIGYGVSDELDVYARLGTVNVKEMTPGASSGNDLAYGLGARYTFLRQDNIEWGTGLQVNWVRINKNGQDEDPDNRVGSYRAKIRGYDMLWTAGPTIDLDMIKVYGGGYFYHMNYNMDYRIRDAAGAWWFNQKGTFGARTGSMFGGFIGAQYDLPIDAVALSINMDLASSFASDWSFGTGLALKF